MLLEKAREQTILDQVVNARATDGTGISPVFLAAQEGHLEIVELLVEAGALVDTYFINDACYEESPIDLGMFRFRIDILCSCRLRLTSRNLVKHTISVAT